MAFTTRAMQEKMEKAGLLPLRRQAEISARIIEERLNKLLPAAMEAAGLDCWLVIGSEYNEDPLFRSLFTFDLPTARRVSALCFHQQNDGSVKRYSFSARSPLMDKLYENKLNRGEELWPTLAKFLAELNPSHIAVNKSDHFGICDGLSSSHFEQLTGHLNPDLRSRLASAEALANTYMQQLTSLELDLLATVVEVTQDIIDLTFSTDRIELGKTTTTDLEWFMRECMSELNCLSWFGPDVNLQRKGEKNTMFTGVIEAGDLLHCDIGISPLYIKLHSDIQRLAYVLKPGEAAVPGGIAKIMRNANRFQDITMQALEPQKTGNLVFSEALAQGHEEDLNPALYSHPIGTYGHGAGTLVGRYDHQQPLPVKGDYLINKNSAYALELNCFGRVPEWDDQEVFTYLEEDIAVKEAPYYLHGRQTDIFLLKFD